MTEPWIVLTSTDDPIVRDQVATLVSLGGVARFLDSANMLNTRGLFREFADSLGFPDYFGNNWYALVDCLDDLHGSWHGDRAVVVVIRGADLLIDLDYFPLFVAILCEAAERANLSLDSDGIPRSREPIALHFVFLIDHVDLGIFATLLANRPDLIVSREDGRLLISSKEG